MLSALPSLPPSSCILHSCSLCVSLARSTHARPRFIECTLKQQPPQNSLPPFPTMRSRLNSMLASAPREAAFTTQTRADINFPKGWRKDRVHAATTTAPLFASCYVRQGERTSEEMADGIMTMTEGEVFYSTLRSLLTTTERFRSRKFDGRSRRHCSRFLLASTEATRLFTLIIKRQRLNRG